MPEEFSFSNGKKLNREDFRQYIKSGQLDSNEKFKKLLSAFETGNLGHADDIEIDNMFNAMSKYAQKNGNSIFETDEAESFLNDTKTVFGKSLKSEGLNVSELFGLFKNTPETHYSENVEVIPQESVPEKTYDEIKTETINFIANESGNALQNLLHYDPGLISKGYNAIKDSLQVGLNESSLQRRLYYENETAELLRRAQNGELTAQEYYDSIAETLYELFPKENLNEDSHKKLKNMIKTLSPRQIEEFSKKIIALPDPDDANYNEAKQDFLKQWISVTHDLELGVNSDRQSISHSQSVKTPYKLKNPQEIITFERVFFERYGKTYEPQAFEKLSETKNTYLVVNSMYQLDMHAHAILDPAIEAFKNNIHNNLTGNTSNQAEDETTFDWFSNGLIEVMNSLGLTNDESKNNFLKKFTTEVSVKDGKIVCNNGGNARNGLFQLSALAEDMLNYLDKRSPSAEDVSKLANQLAEDYTAVFGQESTNSLTETYINASEGAVSTLRSGVEYGSATVAVVAMVFERPDIALVAGAVGAFGGTLLEGGNELGRENPDDKKFDALYEELKLNSALFAVGLVSGAAGNYAKALTIINQCPKLVQCITEIGVDATLSLLGTQILTGQIDIEAEAMSQIIAVVAGIIGSKVHAGRQVHLTGTKPEPSQVRVTPERTPDQIHELNQRITEQNQKISELTGEDYQISDIDRQVLMNLEDGQSHVITDKNNTQIKLTKHGEDFDIEVLGKAPDNNYAAHSTNDIREIHTGSMERNQSYTLNMDKLPMIDIGNGEIIDLEMKAYKNAILSLDEGESFTIGRDGNFTTDPNNKYTSREHIVIFKQNGVIKIRDMSLNGSKVISDASSAPRPKYLQRGRMEQNQPYILDENNLPTLRIAETEVLDLNMYKAMLNDLKEGESLTIGREGDISLANGNGISRKHLVIYRSNGVLKIKDLSLNGTVVEPKSFVGRMRDRVNNILDYFNLSELNEAERNVLETFKDNEDFCRIVETSSSPKEIIKNIMKVLDDTNLVDPKIKNAILHGNADMGRSGIVDCTVDKNILNDVVKLANGEDYIKKFPSETPEAEIMRETPVGEVAIVDGVLYVNNGTNLEKINMSEPTFRRLFPPIKRFSTHQGEVGDCYLVSPLENLYSKPKGRVQIYRMIGEDANGIYTITANSGYEKTYFYRLDSEYKHIKEEGGLAIIEQGYCKNELAEAVGFDPTETRIMEINAGGWAHDAIFNLLRKQTTCTRDPDSIQNYIREYGNNEDYVINVGSLAGSDTNAMSKKYDLYEGHIYSIKGYNSATDCVIISNPWHSGLTVEIPMSEFLQYFDNLTILKL